MGHQISAGDKGIEFTDGSWLIVRWCERYTKDEPPVGLSQNELYTWWEERIGWTEISEDAVKLANDNVPQNYLVAKEMGFLDGDFRNPIDESAFRECREFLMYAAEGNYHITGSY